MHPSYRDGKALVGEPAQQAGRRRGPRRGAEGFDEKYLEQAGEDDIASGPPFTGLVSQEVHEGHQPRLAANMHELRKERDQQARVRRGEDAVAHQRSNIGRATFEGTSMETVRSLFETNTFGTMAMTQALLPQFRQRKAGVIVNVTSAVTLRSLPMLSVYTASKAAINAFTESLALELQPFNVRVSLVIPGMSPETSFGQTAQARMRDQGVSVPEAYSDFTRSMFERVMAQRAAPSTSLTRSIDVAEVIWRAVNDPSCPTRLPAGADAVEVARST